MRGNSGKGWRGKIKTSVVFSVCVFLAALLSGCLRSGGSSGSNGTGNGKGSFTSVHKPDDAAVLTAHKNTETETENITSDLSSETIYEEQQPLETYASENTESTTTTSTTTTSTTTTRPPPAHTSYGGNSLAAPETETLTADGSGNSSVSSESVTAVTYQTESSLPVQTSQEVDTGTTTGIYTEGTAAPPSIGTAFTEGSSSSQSIVFTSSAADISEITENSTLTEITEETTSAAETDASLKTTSKAPASAVTDTESVTAGTVPVQTSAPHTHTDEPETSLTKTAAESSSPPESRETEISTTENTSSALPVPEEMPSNSSGSDVLYYPVFDTDVIAWAVYVPESISITNGSYLKSSDSVTMRQLVQINELISILSDVGYKEMSADEIKAEEEAIMLWRDNHSGAVVTQESLSFYDKNGIELFRFESDTRTALAYGRGVSYFSRLIKGSKQYVINSGSIYRGGILSLVSDQVLEENDFLPSEELAEIARRQVAGYMHNFESIDPVCEIYTPGSVIITVDGELLGPESFKKGEKLCDCVFSYRDGNKMIVTLNARTGKVYQVKMEPVDSLQFTVDS